MLYSYARLVDKLTFNALYLPLKLVYTLQAQNKPFNALKTFNPSIYIN